MRRLVHEFAPSDPRAGLALSGPMMADTAAVVIPVFNAAATIARAVTSALAQDGVAEVVVVDDASADGSAARAEAAGAGDPRLRILRLPRNAGPGAARNAAIAASAAPWIAPLDSDDFMEPGRIAALIARGNAGGWDFVADDVLKVVEGREDGARARLWSESEIGDRQIGLAEFVRGNLVSERAGRREMGFLKPLMRRACLEELGLAYAEEMRLGEDYELYARALARGARFVLTDPAGYVAVVRPGSLSGAHSAPELAALLAADRRLLAERELAPGGREALNAHVIDTHKRWAWARLIEAVRRRDAWEAMRCFAAPPSVVATLAANLAEQAVLRTRRRLGGGASG